MNKHYFGIFLIVNFFLLFIYLFFFVYRVEEIPNDELELNDNELLVPVNHFSKEVYSTFGTPFLIKIVHVRKIKKLKTNIIKVYIKKIYKYSL